MPTDLPVPYVTLPYLSEMELGYAAADLMLCRGGAMTCAEVAAIGLPAIYVPYPHSNQEQKRNALPVVRGGRRPAGRRRRADPGLDGAARHPADPRPAAAGRDGRRRGRGTAGATVTRRCWTSSTRR